MKSQDVILIRKPDGWRAAFQGSLSRPRPSIAEAVRALLQDLYEKQEKDGR